MELSPPPYRGHQRTMDSIRPFYMHRYAETPLFHPSIFPIAIRQGRIQYDIFLWPIPPSTPSSSTEPTGYLIEYDSRSSEAPPLLSLLKRYILRSKVTAKDASDHYDVWAAWGGNLSTEAFERQWRFGNRGAVEPVWESHEAWRGAGSVPTSLRDLRAVGMGLRMLVRKGDPREWK